MHSIFRVLSIFKARGYWPGVSFVRREWNGMIEEVPEKTETWVARPAFFRPCISCNAKINYGTGSSDGSYVQIEDILSFRAFMVINSLLFESLNTPSHSIWRSFGGVAGVLVCFARASISSWRHLEAEFPNMFGALDPRRMYLLRALKDWRKLSPSLSTFDLAMLDEG